MPLLYNAASTVNFWLILWPKALYSFVYQCFRLRHLFVPELLAKACNPFIYQAYVGLSVYLCINNANQE